MNVAILKANSPMPLVYGHTFEVRGNDRNALRPQDVAAEFRRLIIEAADRLEEIDLERVLRKDP